jgi:S-adenosylmethionine synthetase
VFVIGALLIVTGVLVLTLIESKKARAEVAATLGSSVVRQNALSQELRAEIEEINKQNLLEMAAVSKDHHYEMENLRIILSIAEQDLDAALKVASKATQ